MTTTAALITAARTVPCPTCSAQPGRGCHDQAGALTGLHILRLRAARSSSGRDAQ